MDLAQLLEHLHAELAEARVPHALIGGLGLAAHGVVRATLDVDLLVEADGADAFDEIVTAMGYSALQRTEDVGNYSADDPGLARVDALFARRRYTREMLARARPAPTGPPVPVVDAADLIGLKVQASSNNPSRRRVDGADIEQLLRHAPDVDLERVRVYFQLFDREKELDALLAEIQSSP